TGRRRADRVPDLADRPDRHRTRRQPPTRLPEVDTVAARLVDAQAGRLAERVRALSGVITAADWPDRLLTEYALLHLLCVGYRRRDELPAGLGAAVRACVGLPLPDP